MADERIASHCPGLNSVDFLLGADYCTRIVNYKTISCQSGLLAISSKFGWLVFGQEKRPGASGILTLSTVMGVELFPDEKENGNEDLRRFWDLEHFGISDPHHGGNEPNPLTEFSNLITRSSSGRYSVPLPWRPDKKDLLNSNYHQALSRYKRLLRHLQEDPSLFKAYHHQIQEYIRSGYVSRLGSSSDGQITGPEYYLPHRTVVRNEAITTKIRPVFDASARGDHDLSLNDCLETGDNLNPELLEVLLRFRWNRVAWVGDIEKAFLQVEINPEDRDALRFIWTDDVPIGGEQIEPSIFRWNRVTFGLSPSPFLLRIVIRKHLTEAAGIDPSLARYIEENLYMDDLLAGSHSVEEASKTIQRVINAFSGACMRLTKWVTNEPSLKFSVLQTDTLTSSNTASRPIGCDENSKILGVIWKPNEDYWTFDLSKILSPLSNIPESVTKRQMLSVES
ncbi:uncharacterized protein LOC130702736 [Daphnia carinata]|uniref:uncharacterized protein LOC130702736 n=1 Tax=Daphnia carinata TaxID=120202 RepID=UPI00257AAAE1|nr:uncharacterized protein LOC130702736 [Daphnia carinata]